MSPQSLIAHSTVAAVVSDPRLPDNPIVACNDAFVRLTGYPLAEILGRNCRFLRGPETAPERTGLLRQAIKAARPALVELINYRKDGTTFNNAVMIAPLFDERGELIYYIGSQVEVTGPAPGRQETARQMVDRLTRRQRQILAALAKGMLNKQIAHELCLGERTIKMHRAAMLRALELNSSAEAIRLAIEAGL